MMVKSRSLSTVCGAQTYQLLQSAVLLVLLGNQETVSDQILSDVGLGGGVNEGHVLGTGDAVVGRTRFS